MLVRNFFKLVSVLLLGSVLQLKLCDASSSPSRSTIIFRPSSSATHPNPTSSTMPRQEKRIRHHSPSHAISCVSCLDDLRHQSYASLKGTDGENSCSHTLCFGCFSQAHGDRSSDIKLSCPCDSCDRSTREWTVRKFNGSGHESPVGHRVWLPVRDDKDKKHHPTLYFSNRSSVYRREHAIVSVSTSDPDNKRGKLTYVAELKKDQTEILSSEVDQLERIGRTLSPFLVPPREKAS